VTAAFRTWRPLRSQLDAGLAEKAAPFPGVAIVAFDFSPETAIVVLVVDVAVTR